MISAVTLQPVPAITPVQALETLSWIFQKKVETFEGCFSLLINLNQRDWVHLNNPACKEALACVVDKEGRSLLLRCFYDNSTPAGELIAAGICLNAADERDLSLSRSLERAHTIFFIGKLFHQHQKTENAMRYYNQALELYLSMPSHKIASASCFIKLGDCSLDLRQFEDALHYYREGLKIQREIWAESPEIATTLQRIAIHHKTQGNYKEALSCFEAVIRMNKRLLILDISLALDLRSIAISFQSESEYEQARILHTRVLEIQKETLGPHVCEVAISYSHVGVAWQSQGKYRLALDFYTRAREILEKNDPQDPRLDRILDLADECSIQLLAQQENPNSLPLAAKVIF